MQNTRSDPTTRPLLPRISVESYAAASVIDRADMSGRSMTFTWLSLQLEIGLTRRDR